MKRNSQIHGFHLVDPSPWPILAAFSALMLTFGGVMSMHGYSNGAFLWRFGFAMILFVMYVWWRDVVREGTYEGQHTMQVQKGLKMGMILFIVSEIMFFFAFFWAFFHASLNPNFYIGGVWPPIILPILGAWEIPLINSVLLLTSGATVTWAHHSLLLGSKEDLLSRLFETTLLGFIFTTIQLYEYGTAPFSISDGIYASNFYMLTGFHGFHVIIGTCFLAVCTKRIFEDHFTLEHHVGFESAAWYWHFVDIVWLYVFLSLYWWGS